MFEHVLAQMRAKVLSLDYIVSLHAEEEMNDDGLTVFDLECCILNGQTTERQRDYVTGESKYRLAGMAVAGDGIELIAKLSVTGTLVIVTIYCL